MLIGGLLCSACSFLFGWVCVVIIDWLLTYAELYFLDIYGTASCPQTLVHIIHSWVELISLNLKPNSLLQPSTYMHECIQAMEFCLYWVYAGVCSRRILKSTIANSAKTAIVICDCCKMCSPLWVLACSVLEAEEAANLWPAWSYIGKRHWQPKNQKPFLLHASYTQIVCKHGQQEVGGDHEGLLH